jgi:hypothetical protein
MPIMKGHYTDKLFSVIDFQISESAAHPWRSILKGFRFWKMGIVWFTYEGEAK